MLRAQLGLIITSSSAFEFDHGLIKVWAMVWIWVLTMVWRWSDQKKFVLKSLVRDVLCLESLIRGNLGLESLIRVNFRLESLIRDNFSLESLIRQKLGSGPQPGSGRGWPLYVISFESDTMLRFSELYLECTFSGVYYPYHPMEVFSFELNRRCYDKY